MKLSPNFSLDEFTTSQTAARHGIDNTPSETALKNLYRTAQLMEQVRAIWGKPIRISSGFRNEKVNAIIGGSERSQHVLGCAADFTVAGLSIDDTIAGIVANDLPYDQLIHEFNAWVHISVPSYTTSKPRRQVLVIDKKGVRPWVSPS